jgi:hypothetical protein
MAAAMALVAGLVLLVGIAVAAPRFLAAPTGKVPHMVEEAIAAGVVHAYDGGFEFFVGGGVAAFDCDSNGLPDLYFAGGANPAALFVNRANASGPLAFERKPSPATDLTAVTGAYPIDIDGDDLSDLVVLRRGENVMLRGIGDCQFERANENWAFVGGDAWSTAFSAKWDRAAAWPTLAIGNYLAYDSPGGVTSCMDNELVTPSGSEREGRSFGLPQPLAPGWCTLSMLFTDWDRSGRRDLRVSNDRHYYRTESDGEEQLWRIEPGMQARQYTREQGWERLRVWGMGIASYDVTGDGYPEYYLTSQADNKLQSLADGPGAPTYEDIALDRNATASRPYAGDTTMPSTGWHTEFQDVNNDGLMDLFVSKGNVEAMPDFATRDPSNLMLGQPDGTFLEAGSEAGIDDFASARGGAMVDLNADGLLDLVIVDRRQNVRVYRNVGAGTADAPVPLGNWVAINLRQADANRDAIGAWIELRVGEHVQQRELTIGGGHASGELGPIHFGLGSATSAEVRITWPNGAPGDWQSVNANSTYTLQPGVFPERAEH